MLASVKRSSERGEVTVGQVANVEEARAALRGYRAASEDILAILSQIV